MRTSISTRLIWVEELCICFIVSKSIMFSNNMAVQNGGALHLDNNFYMEMIPR